MSDHGTPQGADTDPKQARSPFTRSPYAACGLPYARADRRCRRILNDAIAFFRRVSLRSAVGGRQGLGEGPPRGIDGDR